MRRAIAEAQDSRRRLRENEERAREPIAIVGMGCRLPGGVRGPEDLWRLVAEGRGAVTPFPRDRGWDLDALAGDGPESSGTTQGGFLDDAAGFDAGVFGISPREALAMDPQQRLLLETSWEALERAGIDPLSLRGSRTGVFMGTASQDYANLVLAAPGADLYGSTGYQAGVLSGRLSYVYGAVGPTATVDTACSSFLVSLHLAAQALRAGECDLALAGAATVMATPALFSVFSRQDGLAADGLCKAFADAADGTGWAEGVGTVVVERLSDALRLGHPVDAVVRASAVNSDGASNGLSAPNGPSQQRVIRQALTAAGLAPADVDAVEAHGTGTRLGDPIEAQALLATYGQDRDTPLYLGSAKSNMGHTQAAAGLVGLVKTVMALRHRELAPTLHVDRPSTKVDWEAGAVELVTVRRPWPAVDRPRRAGVSAFGISGTNAHVILEEAPAPEGDAGHAQGAHTPTVTPAGPVPWLLSARGAPALRGQAAALHAHLTGLQEPPAAVDVGHSLATTRAALEHRAVVVGDGTGELLDGLRALADGTPAPGVVTGRAQLDSDRKVVMVFPGQGSQWAGMGRELLDSAPEFAAVIEDCARALAPYADFDLVAALRTGEGLERVDVAQCALWATMVALAALWRSYGIRPAAVIGHSQGEIAAACVAGALGLDDGARVVALRSRAIGAELSGKGTMVSVAAPVEEVERRLAAWGGRASVAAVNGPASVVVSGELGALRELVESCVADGVRAKAIPVDYASHSAQVELIEDRLAADLAGLAPRAGDVPFLSTVTGEWTDTTTLGARYWYENLRGTVRLEPAVRTLLETGHDLFVEVSPHPVLTMPVQETIDTAATAATAAAASGAVVIGSLRRDDGGPARLLCSLAEAYAHGARVDWHGPLAGGRRVDLPTYAFQHEPYWLTPAPSASDPAALGLTGTGHPVLRAALPVAGGAAAVLTGRLDPRTQPWLGQHLLLGSRVVPDTALADWVARAAQECGCDTVRTLRIDRPPVVGDVPLDVQVVTGAPRADGTRTVEVHTRHTADTEGPWTRHAEGVIGAAHPVDEGAAWDRLAVWPPDGATADDTPRARPAWAAYGPVFDSVVRTWRRGAELFAEIALDPAAHPDAAASAAHPALLQALLTAAVNDGADPEGPPRLPSVWHGLRIAAPGAGALRVRVAPATGAGALTVTAVAADGAPVLSAAVEARTAEPAHLAPAAPGGGLHRIEWDPLPLPPAAGSGGTWPVLGTGTATDALAAAVPGATATEDPTGAAALLLPWDSGDGGDAGARGAGDGGDSHDDGAGPVHAAVHAALAALRGHLADPRDDLPPLAVVTRAAVATAAGERIASVADAAVRGLVRAAQSEYPGRFLLADWDGDPRSAAALPAALTAALAAAEPEVALREGRAAVPRLTAAAPAGEPHWDPEGTVLVTGGTGTLGAAVASHLVTRHGVRGLLLASRRGQDAPGAQALREELRAAGAHVDIAACDVSSRAELAALLNRVPAERPLRGVVHTAGVLADALLDKLTDDGVDRVLAPKADAALHLDALTRGMDLTAFVLFSSYAGVSGSLGQGNYAAANTALDALAQRRAADGLPATSLAWGVWREASGMTGDLADADLTRLATSGMSAIPLDHGLALLDTATALPDPLLVPVLFDRAALARTGQVPALLRRLFRVPPKAAAPGAPTAGGGDGTDLARRLSGRTPVEQEKILFDLVAAHTATVLGHRSADAVDRGRGFLDQGITSLTAVDLRNRLSAETGLALPATMIFDFPAPAALVAHLRDRLGAGGAGTAREPVLEQLAAVEAAVATGGLDASVAEALAKRVATLHWRLDAGDTPARAGTSDLTASTDDEMFALIDKELGLA
ncbi:type I polyketide synthase [Streptomyces sp. NPDC050560]|uniref:type I polyketide synthase n=1 Tax=Streptomyces sp. NPDC050560 TaxID=3365630 RepID=UPI0037927E9B